MQTFGINMSCRDVTSREDLKRVHSEICRTFPKIAGVANGALILRDKVFANMDLESFLTVMKPKVHGTAYLSEMFSENTLVSFIPFSSIVATIGNVGQSAYTAANCFMKTLVAQRRKCGLAGSTIDISRVLGVGYVEREAKAQGKLTEKQIERIMNVTVLMSESDLHQLFAEAVVAERPNSGENIDIFTGVRTLTSEEIGNVYWAANVKCSHFIQVLGDMGGEEVNEMVKVPVKAQLLSAKNLDDMHKILQGKLSFPHPQAPRDLSVLGLMGYQANGNRCLDSQANCQPPTRGRRAHSRNYAIGRPWSGLAGGG